MPELWEHDPDDNDFALPGDEEITGQVAETEQTETTEGVQEAVEEAERPRDDQGRFTAKEQETEPEKPAEPELILGKFKSTDDLIKSYQELEQKLGSQGNELSQALQHIDQRFAEFEEEPEPVNVTTLQEELDANPARIPTVARDAYQRGDQQALNAVLVSWEYHDPAGAKAFEREIMLDMFRKEQQQAQQVAMTREQENRSVMQEFTQAHPDLDAVAPVMQQIVNDYPSIGRLLVSQDTRERREGLEALYSLASRRASDNATAENRQTDADNKADENRAIEEAQVVSGNATHSETKKSGAELVGEQWAELDAAVDAGWQLTS